MQTELGGPIAFEPVPVHYAYVAKYSYTDIVVQNDNFLRLAAYADTYQTPGPCGVVTFPEGRQVEYPDRLGNTVHRVRITAPHQGLIIAATGKVCLNRHTPVVSDLPLGGAEYGLEAQEFLSASRLVRPGERRECCAGGCRRGDYLALHCGQRRPVDLHKHSLRTRAHVGEHYCGGRLGVAARRLPGPGSSRLSHASRPWDSRPLRQRTSDSSTRGDPRLDRIFASSPRLVARRSHPWRRNPHWHRLP